MTNSLQAQISSEHHCVPVLDSMGSHGAPIDGHHVHDPLNTANSSPVGIISSTNSSTDVENRDTLHHEPMQVNSTSTPSSSVHELTTAVTTTAVSTEMGDSNEATTEKSISSSQLAMQHLEEAIERVVQKSIKWADSVITNDLNEDLAQQSKDTETQKRKPKARPVLCGYVYESELTNEERAEKAARKKKVAETRAKNKAKQAAAVEAEQRKKKKNKSGMTDVERKKAAFGPYVAVERVPSINHKDQKVIQFKVINQVADEKDAPRSRVRTELVKSVFGAKTQADASADGPWICSFCQKPPHHRALGDLFGPYMFSASAIVSDSASTSSFTADAQINDSTIEVWMHEDCVVWSNGTHFDGTRIRNVEQAYQDSCQVTCSKCSLKGASLRCLQKDCDMYYHFICAQDDQAQMLKDHFSIYCAQHKVSLKQI